MNQFLNLDVNGSRQFCEILAVTVSPLLALLLFSLANWLIYLSYSAETGFASFVLNWNLSGAFLEFFKKIVCLYFGSILRIHTYQYQIPKNRGIKPNFFEDLNFVFKISIRII